MHTKRILFIGAGRMAQAMISGMIEDMTSSLNRGKPRDHVEWNITVSNRANAERLAEVQQRFGVHTTADWQDKAANADVIVLAIPPGEHPNTLAELATIVQNPFIITVAGGIGISPLEKALPAGTPVAWVMPNTAASIGQSMTLFTCGTSTTQAHRDMLGCILQGIGPVQECTEQQIHDLTAITGSAPAFLYRMAQEMNSLAVGFGMSEASARNLVAQMFYGSACMLNSMEDPAILEDEVTSPGGSTAAGIQVLEASNFANLVREAVLATNRRAAELTAGIRFHGK
jgi:pyrroline-5-carboxylate reductase